jgi:hypothetical protein
VPTTLQQGSSIATVASKTRRNPLVIASVCKRRRNQTVKAGTRRRVTFFLAALNLVAEADTPRAKPQSTEPSGVCATVPAAAISDSWSLEHRGGYQDCHA